MTAGTPITAVENIEEYFPLPERLAPPDEHVFMLEIMGESMIDAGILDQDYVIVKQQNTANNGDIVVAMTEDDEATVKRFSRRKPISAFSRKPDDGADHPSECDDSRKVIGVSALFIKTRTHQQNRRSACFCTKNRLTSIRQ
ncbi:S24 family peptidase [Bacillus licheniformis]|nr:S24 family peptidase [Bacillus licheniformis]